MRVGARPRLLPPILVLASILLASCAQTGRIRDATGDLSVSGKESPGDLYVKLAVEYLREGQLQTALVRGKKALREDPRNAQAHNVIALIYQRLDQQQLAESHFREAIRLQPEDPYILNAYASYLCERRKFTEAKAQYEKALANPLYSAPWVAKTNLGTCAKRSGKNAQAESYFQEALRVNPRFGPALVAMAELDYDRDRYKSARTYLDRYFKVARPTAQALLLAVRVERKLGARKRANTYAQFLRKSYPDSREALQL